MQDVNNIGKVYRHNKRVVYHSIVVYTEDSYHASIYSVSKVKPQNSSGHEKDYSYIIGDNRMVMIFVLCGNKCWKCE